MTVDALLPDDAPALGISQSLSGQAWRWRSSGRASDAPSAPDDIITRILLTRGAPADALSDYLKPTLRAFMPDPSIFNDMDTAVDRLVRAVRSGEQVVIYGDYDVDGATSAALLILLLRQLGLDARPYIPDRLLEGYGPGAEALVRLKGEGADLVVTVDCGAQAFEALAAAKAAGLDVIVVDHHKCSPALPEALALVNPNRLDEVAAAAAHGHLAAVGVAFLLGAALVRALRGRNWFADRAEPDLMALLDIVALGTVADVAQLKGLNRAFVAQGLKVMARRGNIGLAALADVASLKRAPLAHDLGFALGPRINAGGRVGQADLGAVEITGDTCVGGADARNPDGSNEFDRRDALGFERTDRIGRIVGGVVARLVASAAPVPVASLEVRSTSYRAPSSNATFELGRSIGILDLDPAVYDPSLCPGATGLCGLLEQSAISLLDRTGAPQVQIVSVPGELFPELYLGVAGHRRSDCPAADTGRPAEPSIRDAMVAPHRLVIGLSPDEIGYLVPGYDFHPAMIFDEARDECQGQAFDPRYPRRQVPSHYHESLSVGVEASSFVTCKAVELLRGSDAIAGEAACSALP